MQRQTERLSQFYYARMNELKDSCVSSLAKNFPSDNPINILSIGHGDHPIEFDVFQKLYRDRSIHFIGIEINPAATKACQRTYDGVKNAEFHTLNAANTTELKKAIGTRKIHQMIFRQPVLNPNCIESFKPVIQDFKNMFQTIVPSVLTLGGILLVTLYMREERDICLELLTNLVNKKNIVELSEKCSDENYEATDYRTILNNDGSILADLEIPLHADRYVLQVLNFQPRRQQPTYFWEEKQVVNGAQKIEEPLTLLPGFIGY